MAAVGSNRTFAALSTDGSNADKPALGSNSGLWRSRPFADLRGLRSEWQQGALTDIVCEKRDVRFVP